MMYTILGKSMGVKSTYYSKFDHKPNVHCLVLQTETIHYYMMETIVIQMSNNTLFIMAPNLKLELLRIEC
jgi:hypothetical protein